MAENQGAVTITAPVLKGEDPLLGLQAAIVPELQRTLDVPVYDHVHETSEAPYVTWNTAWLAERDTLNGTADRVWFQLDVWSEWRGYREAAQITRDVVARLHHCRVLLDGWSPIHVLREQAHETRDPDGSHRRIAITFNCPYVSPIQRSSNGSN